MMAASTTAKQIDLGAPSTGMENATRRWLGWDKPILPAVVQQLMVQFADETTWDLRELLLVLPGGLAIRRLGELLALAAQEQRKILYPPQMVTAGALPEELYVAKYPFASDLVQQLAWSLALQSAPSVELAQIVPVPPPRSAAQQWLELAKIFSGVHRELASDRLNFGKVLAALGDNHPESPRWRALAKIQNRYLAQLDALQLWDIQTARLCALDFREPATTKRILVIGCVDLNRTQRGFLEQVAEQVEIWIAAPPTATNYFDAYGSLNSSAWQEFELELPPQTLLVGNSPSDQAELTCACLAELGERYHVREITIGVPEGSMISELKYQLDQAGVPARYGPGTPLGHSEPALLLSLIGQYVGSRSYTTFAALVRHPAIEMMLAAQKVDVPRNWLSQLDNYYREALPKVIDRFINTRADGAAVYALVSKAINRWLAKLTDRPRAISHWVEPLLQALRVAYGKQSCDLDDPLEGPLHAAAVQICDAIVSLGDIPADLEPTMSVPELIDWLLRSHAGNLVPEADNETAVEMLGWLELALDDAPALIVTGMHDGVVPESVNSDAFLPNSLRRQLGMMDNARRYARDIFSLHVLTRSRAHLRLVVGKSDANGDPLIPSRLLLACELGQLPDRVMHLVQEDEIDALPEVEKRWPKRDGPSQLRVPSPTDVKPPRQMTVTAFRDYLACPYRFYLRHVLKLRGDHDAAAELDAAMFGNLIHDTLQLLGEGPISRSTDGEELKEFLVGKLHEVATERYGPAPPAAVLIQMEQAQQRLEAFAPLQAARAAEGWEIRFTEQGVGLKHQVMLGNSAPLHLIGRIDRIDYHPASGQWAIWDYKTSENAKKPISVHWSKKDGWQALNLPLYLPVA
ncbi:MAG: PD-(D/E)XK nuclease family protein, partial [Planctomycetales bacterium]|nr:PD-(D/E)XK nuclease family protein [Planctomycetales bacterium]